jgi:hypothetical protein
MHKKTTAKSRMMMVFLRDFDVAKQHANRVSKPRKYKFLQIQQKERIEPIKFS